MHQGTDGRKGVRCGSCLKRRVMAAVRHLNLVTCGDLRRSKAAKRG
jgi:hypothetical protein